MVLDFRALSFGRHVNVTQSDCVLEFEEKIQCCSEMTSGSKHWVPCAAHKGPVLRDHNGYLARSI